MLMVVEDTGPICYCRTGKVSVIALCLRNHDELERRRSPAGRETGGGFATAAGQYNDHRLSAQLGWPSAVVVAMESKL